MEKYCIFILHGSKSFEIKSSIDKLKEQLQNKIDCSFSFCYLCYNTPSLPEALENAFLKGAHNIICYPLFILPGQHIREDIPNIIKDFQKTHNECKIKLLPSLVENQYFANFLAKSLETNNE